MDQTGANGAPDDEVEDELMGPHEVYEDDPAEEIASPFTPTPSGDPDVDMAPELIIASFADEATAREAYDEIREAEKEQILLLIDAARVDRDEGNRLHIHESEDMRAGEGALWGAAIGGLLGLISGPLGLVIGGAAGAAIGGVAAEGSDAGMSDERLREFADSLKPGASMVVVAVAHYWSELTSAFLTRAGGKANTILLTDDLAHQLDVG